MYQSNTIEKALQKYIIMDSQYLATLFVMKYTVQCFFSKKKAAVVLPPLRLLGLMWSESCCRQSSHTLIASTSKRRSNRESFLFSSSLKDQPWHGCLVSVYNCSWLGTETWLCHSFSKRRPDTTFLRQNKWLYVSYYTARYLEKKKSKLLVVYPPL